MAQKYVEMFANTLITISSSEDEGEVPKLTIRRTPPLEEIAKITTTEPKTPPKNPSHNLPPEKIVGAALKKLGITNDKAPAPIQHPRRHPIQMLRPIKTPSANRPIEHFKHIVELLSNPKHLTIALEGNLAIGKSTLINRLKSMADTSVLTIREPIDQWTHNGSINLLAKTYQTPHKWSFVFQTLVMSNMLQNHITASNTKIMERSLGSAYNVFLQAHHANRTMDHAAILALQEWYHMANELFNIEPDVIIYLRAPPNVAMRRLKLRNRKEERHVSYKYLTQIHEFYDEWLLNGSNFSKVIPVDADQSPDEILHDLNTQLAFFNTRHSNQ